MKNLKRYVKPAILLIFIILAVSIGRMTDVGQYLNQEMLEQLIGSLGIWGPIAYMAFYFGATIFFLPGTPLSIAAGVLFGTLLGTVYIVIGATLGASVAFLIARFFGKDFVDKILKDKFKTLEKYDEKLADNGFLTVLFFRLVPLFPFNGLNFALGLTRVRFVDYVLATAIGIIPGSFILANIGGNAMNYTSPGFILSIVAFIALAFIPYTYKKIRKKKQAE